MPDSFEQWMANTCTPPEHYSLAQYGRYIEGWRNAAPWSYSGMSLAYDRWAESKWDDIQDRDRLKLAWTEGQAIIAKAVSSPLDRNWASKSTQEAADFMLTFRETIAALVLMAGDGLSNLPGDQTP